ncbi:MAG TPA: DUF4266 domain-containing protein [Vicinamibacterales bacterium]|jgi:hypothetical protein
MTGKPRVGLLIAGALLLAALTGGCATVQPWQRGRLADPCMVFDYDGGQADFASHWQTAREGSAGGFGVQGGGCGCK